jgi:acyl-CoA dehydrogenase
MWAGNRTLRIADGPDEVHRNAVAKLELAKHMTLEGEDTELPITRS